MKYYRKLKAKHLSGPFTLEVPICSTGPEMQCLILLLRKAFGALSGNSFISQFIMNQNMKVKVARV